MACSVNLSSYSLSDCFSSKGGIKTIWLAPYVEDAFTLSSAGTVTGFATGVTWYKQEMRRNQATLTSTYNYNEEAGSSYVSTEGTIVYSKMDKENRMNANALIKGDFIAVYRDANDSYIALGVEEPCKATAGEGATGQNREDANRYSITITDYNSNWPPMLDATAISALS